MTWIWKINNTKLNTQETYYEQTAKITRKHNSNKILVAKWNTKYYNRRDPVKNRKWELLTVIGCYHWVCYYIFYCVMKKMKWT